MSDPFDRLKEQMRRATDARRARRLGRWRVRSAVAVLTAGMLVSGGALAATRLAGSGTTDGHRGETLGRTIAFRAERETARLPVCRPAQPTDGLTDTAPLSQVATLLPVVATPPDPPTVLDRRIGLGDVLRSTVHRRILRGGAVVTVWVQQGSGLVEPRDRDRCRVARRARAEELLRGRSAPVRAWALRRLAEQRDVAPGQQTLWITTHLPGTRGAGGTGIAVTPGNALRSGLQASGGGAYTGVTGPGTASVRVLVKHGRAPVGRATPDRLYVVRIRRGAGPARLQELDASGGVLRTVRLR